MPGTRLRENGARGAEAELRRRGESGHLLVIPEMELGGLEPPTS